MDRGTSAERTTEDRGIILPLSRQCSHVVYGARDQRVVGGTKPWIVCLKWRNKEEFFFIILAMGTAGSWGETGNRERGYSIFRECVHCIRVRRFNFLIFIFLSLSFSLFLFLLIPISLFISLLLSLPLSLFLSVSFSFFFCFSHPITPHFALFPSPSVEFYSQSECVCVEVRRFAVPSGGPSELARYSLHRPGASTREGRDIVTSQAILQAVRCARAVQAGWTCATRCQMFTLRLFKTLF